MKTKVFIVLLPLVFNGSCLEDVEPSDFVNSTNPDTDLYVIHATVYQVGILTNKTDNATDNSSNTNQESVTFYRTNGSNIDLSGIPEPLWTNVTAQSIVGVAPVQNTNFEDLVQANILRNETHSMKTHSKSAEHISKRSTDDVTFRLFRRDTGIPVKTVNGTAIIPPEIGVQSIALPPLLSLNNNLSSIPVPIPNTSVVHYAKVNTFFQTP